VARDLSAADPATALPPQSCAGCGACCEEQGVPPGYLVPHLLDFLPEVLRQELSLHLEEEARVGATRHARELPCIWYDAATRRCSHYELRPPRCREFALGAEGCLFWRERRGPRDQSGPERGERRPEASRLPRTPRR
jgi:Fe-S-cluster containining protein